MTKRCLPTARRSRTSARCAVRNSARWSCRSRFANPAWKRSRWSSGAPARSTSSNRMVPGASDSRSPAMSALARLDTLLGEVMDLRHAADLIEWDERVYMPDGGVAVHGEMSATLRRLAHEKFTASEVGAAIEMARRQIGSDDPDTDSARRVRITARE